MPIIDSKSPMPPATMPLRGTRPLRMATMEMPMMPREKSSGAANSSTSGFRMGMSIPRMTAPTTPPSSEAK